MAADRDRLLARRVSERVAERHQVEEVVGVEVTDQHGVDVDVLAEVTELGENAVAAVQQQREAVLLYEVPATRPAGVLPRWRLAKHGDPHAAPLSRSPITLEPERRPVAGCATAHAGSGTGHAGAAGRRENGGPGPRHAQL